MVCGGLEVLPLPARRQAGVLIELPCKPSAEPGLTGRQGAHELHFGVAL